ncbi:hypothetical protein EG329_006681 [Mollisiaceae sp. DMI_Dod_QoI]|nr:hypothetical protein EG329_006681 [Helotiales sp. DMI_Dod_QoI]
MAKPLPLSFVAKKQRILDQLSIPAAEYDDLSPKGSVDEGIRDLIDEINAIEGCVTTSSCAGRVSVFLEGKRKPDVEEDGSASPGSNFDGREKTAGVGGKGGGGRWLFVSHDPVLKNEKQSWIEYLGMKNTDIQKLQENMGSVLERRLIHLKFEPMILHVLTASLQQAQIVLSAALQAGFRESGALNLTASAAEVVTPMVGIRTMGLALESVIGFKNGGLEICMIPEWQLQNLVELSNQRFVENKKRIERFQLLLKESASGARGAAKRQGENGIWEDAQARKERKRAEGLERAKAIKQNQSSNQPSEEVPESGVLEQNL